MGTYAWADAGDDGDGFARHSAEVGDDGEESFGGVHEPIEDGRNSIDMAEDCVISQEVFSNRRTYESMIG